MRSINFLIICFFTVLFFVTACKKSEPLLDETPELDPDKEYKHLRLIDQNVLINDDGTINTALGVSGYLFGSEMHDIVDAAAGWYVLRNDGTVWMLLDTATNQPPPKQVTQLSNITKMEWGGGASAWFIMFLKADGTVWTMGHNQYGQLGDSSTVESMDEPVQVYGLTGVIDIDAGTSAHAIALKADGTVWGWGNNFYGEIGDTLVASFLNNPVKIDGFSSITSITAGNAATYGLRNDGSILACGINTGGQLGNGATSLSANPAPVTVDVLNDAIQISAGNSFALAIRSDSTVWSWGLNAYGNLGNGNTTSQSTPVKVYYIKHAKYINAGGNITWTGYAIERDGITWKWGDNSLGSMILPTRLEE